MFNRPADNREDQAMQNPDDNMPQIDTGAANRNQNPNVSGYSQYSYGSNFANPNGASQTLNSNRVPSNLGMQSEFEDLYQNDLDSNYNEYNQHVNQTFNYPHFYERVENMKWERVLSEENVDDEECKERERLH